MDREQKAQRYETIWEHHKRNSIGEKGKKKKKKRTSKKRISTKRRVAQGRETGSSNEHTTFDFSAISFQLIVRKKYEEWQVYAR